MIQHPLHPKICIFYTVSTINLTCWKNFANCVLYSIVSPKKLIFFYDLYFRFNPLYYKNYSDFSIANPKVLRIARILLAFLFV